MEIQPVQMPITPITSTMAGVAPVLPQASGGVASTSFKDLLSRAVGELNQAQLDASRAATDLATGKAESLHEVVLAMEEAGMALQYAIQIRNKLLEAYQEIARMQI